MRVAFAGTPGFAVPAFAALRARHDLVGALTQPDRPSGRGRTLTPGAVKQAALAAGVPFVQPQTLKSETVRTQLREWHPDLLVVVAFGALLPPEILSIPPLGCINIHASLLPRWRGAAPVQWALLAGDAETGITIMQMDEGLDSGPVLLQRTLPIRPDHTGGTLQDELAALGAEVLIEALAEISAGRLVSRPQPPVGVTVARKITKADAHIDWTCDAERIERQVRAFDPRPVAETSLDGETLRIHEAHVAPSGGEEAAIIGENGESGEILGISRNSIVVRCGQGSLALIRVQRPGRRPVSGREYAQNAPVPTLVGRRFG